MTDKNGFFRGKGSQLGSCVRSLGEITLSQCVPGRVYVKVACSSLDYRGLPLSWNPSPWSFH